MTASTTEPNRLAAFLRLAREGNWCHRWGCTTCAADKFYGGLQDIVDEMGGGLAGKVEIAKSLTMMPLISNEALVEDVLIWLANEIPGDDLSRVLGRTDVGKLFDAMKIAYAAAQARRRAHDLRNDPAIMEAERARKKAERKADHEKRLAAKAVRDAARKGTT
jgi:hypothetical protein